MQIFSSKKICQKAYGMQVDDDWTQGDWQQADWTESDRGEPEPEVTRTARPSGVRASQVARNSGASLNIFEQFLYNHIIILLEL